MGREKLMYYDDELYEMLPSSKSSFLPDIVSFPFTINLGKKAH